MNDRKKQNNIQSLWNSFLKELNKHANSPYKIFESSIIVEIQDDLIVYVEESIEESAKKLRGKLKAKLDKKHPEFKNRKLIVREGEPTEAMATTGSSTGKAGTCTNALQALNQIIFLQDNVQPALQASVAAENQCQSFYTELTQRTEDLADRHLRAKFNWRLRVGGMRGFNDLLLPAFHPVYGVPYVTSSSLKGAVRAWAKQNHQSEAEINRLLGTIDNGIGCVQFLDAFPTGPCLTVDMANPQWSWDNQQQVKYQPVPHALLSMEKPELSIGLVRTRRGRIQKDNLDDVETVKQWLEGALASGIGSRVSAGYGRTQAAASLPHSSKHKFQLWTQGMYGAFPPSKENKWQGTTEFRPTAIRGMLRYWFRAIALGKYSPSGCRSLEATLFGTIEPQAKEGKIRIAVDSQEIKGNRNRPYCYEGTIVLEAFEEKYLTLMEKVLQLASHLGGVGRGSRRPLHWNNPYPGLRGCYWQVESQILPCDRQTWQQFRQSVVDAFVAIQSLGTPGTGSPGSPGGRKQDVLNSDAGIYIVPSHSLKHPQKVNDWSRVGTTIDVRGDALDLLYEERFKGVNQQGKGNANVGGKIGEPAGTPSYVLIQSNFPQSGTPYQAVTIFGVNQRDRATFASEIKKLGGIKIDW